MKKNHFFEPDLFVTNLANLAGDREEDINRQERITSIIELVTSPRLFTAEDMALLEMEDIEDALEAVQALRGYGYTYESDASLMIHNMIDVQRGKDNLRHMKMGQVAQSIDFF